MKVNQNHFFLPDVALLKCPFAAAHLMSHLPRAPQLREGDRELDSSVDPDFTCPSSDMEHSEKTHLKTSVRPGLGFCLNANCFLQC